MVLELERAAGSGAEPPPARPAPAAPRDRAPEPARARAHAALHGVGLRMHRPGGHPAAAQRSSARRSPYLMASHATRLRSRRRHRTTADRTSFVSMHGCPAAVGVM